ncbi:emp24/gp25L/p24 family/GOLD-domain-containing protein [Entophlyctis helioformis]|nr:emp24/gp25L/p24 family/GOLD-domain-containing protein [Entophlyctis helioformis]
MVHSMRGASAASMVVLVLLGLASLLAGSVHALRFDLHATTGQGTRKCVESYARRDSVVSGTLDVPARSMQRVDVEIIDDTPVTNKHWSKLSVNGEHKFSFTVHQDANLRFCFTNTLQDGQVPHSDVKRQVTLRVDVGAEATDFSISSTKEKLGPIEAELMRLESLVRDVNENIVTLEGDNDLMHDINQSTFERVTGFSWFTMLALLALGGWQIWYLHSYFKAKKLI